MLFYYGYVVFEDGINSYSFVSLTTSRMIWEMVGMLEGVILIP